MKTMRLKLYLLLSTTFLTFTLLAQPVIYKDASSLLTGTWHGAGPTGTSSLAEVTTNAPFEGTKHLAFTYNYSAWWAGIGLNMDGWGSSSTRNFSGYSFIKIAYRGLSGNQTLAMSIRNGSVFSNEVTLGGANTSYTEAYISISALTNGTSINTSLVTEINLSVGGAQTGFGTVYIDAIELVNTQPGGALPATAATMARSASLGKGLNTANWLEAFWLLPSSSYPEPGRFTRAKIAALRSAGFESFRLPIIFERISPTVAPYTINFNQPALRLVDSMVVWAAEMNFNLIIDNHHGYELTNANYSTEIPRLKALWAQIATKYGTLDPNRYFFEIYNEATPAISNTNFRTVATEVLTTIRTNEQVVHSVIVGASGWNSGPELTNFVPLPDADVIYTFHNYDSFQFTHQGMSWTSPAYLPARTFPQAGEVAAINQVFSNVRAWANSNQVPVFLGEFGASTAADAASRCNWVAALKNATDANSFPYFYWDAISPTDAFGFFGGGVVSQSNAIPCFAATLGLFSAPLSVELQELQAECYRDQAVITWLSHATQRGVSYTIEASNDGSDWLRRTTIYASTQGKYQDKWVDRQPQAYYRIKITEPDGSASYSSIVASNCAPKAQLALYPNPAYGGYVYINTDAESQVDVFDMVGRQVQVSIANDPIGTQLSLNGLPEGTYLVRVSMQNGNVQALPLVIVAP
jgi:endoglucanase